MKGIVMKYLLISMLCLMLTGCAGMFKENNLSVYGSPEEEQAFGIRAGTNVPNVENLEVGASALYMKGRDTKTTTWRYRPKMGGVVRTVEKETVDDWSYGAHLIYRLPMGCWTPYAGAQVPIGNGTWDLGNDIEPLGGIDVKVNETLSTFIEYQQETTNGEDKRFMIGARLRF